MEQQTITFTSECGKFEFTVKESFIKRNQYLMNDKGKMVHEKYLEWKITKEPVYNLMTEFNMKKYLHNTTGPAIIYKETKGVAYFKDGEQLSEEEGKRLQYNTEFADHVIMDLGL